METMDSMPEHRHKNDVDLTLIPSKRKKTTNWKARCHVAEETSQPSDEPIEVISSPEL